MPALEALPKIMPVQILSLHPEDPNINDPF